jgi:hypothetical protein
MQFCIVINLIKMTGLLPIIIISGCLILFYVFDLTVDHSLIKMYENTEDDQNYISLMNNNY